MWLFANAFMDGGMGWQTHLLHSLTPLCKLLHTAGEPNICGGTGPARTAWTAGHETTQTASDGSGFAAVLAEKYINISLTVVFVIIISFPKYFIIYCKIQQ